MSTDHRKQISFDEETLALVNAQPNASAFVRSAVLRTRPREPFVRWTPEPHTLAQALGRLTADLRADAIVHGEWTREQMADVLTALDMAREGMGDYRWLFADPEGP